MCELVAGAWTEPVPFTDLLPLAVDLERFGVAGFGWGVAWLDADGGLQVCRGLGRFADEAPGQETLRAARSHRFVVHLRRPNLLSTIQPADTQPFVDEARTSAFCHNGFLERAGELRGQYAGRLAGRADSEVGWLHFRDRVAEGWSTEKALEDVATTFGGTANLAHLAADGELVVHTANRTNRMFRFRLGDGLLASTAIHSGDESVFRFVYPQAQDREQLPLGSGTVLAPA